MKNKKYYSTLLLVFLVVFVSLVLSKDLSLGRRIQLVKGQHPFAVIVGCSDSRVPPEIIFDQALGDLFVVRVAGNVVGKIEIGSVEYAVEHLNVPLVVVVGHQKCGAVEATIDEGEELLDQTINQNIINVTKTLQRDLVIKTAIEEGKLKVFGAKYNLSSGKLEWLQ